jgi:hypothetical protein
MMLVHAMLNAKQRRVDLRTVNERTFPMKPDRPLNCV